VQQVVTEFGRLDIVVNNAGLMRIGPAAESDPADWDDMLSVNVQGLLYVTRASLPHLIQAAADAPRGVADLVNISSTAGRVARPGNAVYALTKFGVGAFSEALRQEVTAQGIRVTLVEPGAVATELGGHNRPEVREAMQQMFQDVTPLQADDIARAIVYALAQPENVSVNEVLIRPTKQVR